MTERKTWLILLLAALVALWGCSDDDDDVVNPPDETAFEVMAAAGIAYINDNTDCPGIIDADLLHDNLAEYTVIDVRAEADYLDGHIPGAYHATLQTLITDLATIPDDKPYVVACYSGQTAGFAKFAMEMLGYEDVQSLKFGMASWHTSLSGPLNNNIGDALTNPEVTNNNGELVEHAFPALSGYDNDSVVAERVAELLAGGFQSKTYASIRDNLDDYFILNYHSLADYEGTGTNGVPGHIPGAYQFTPYQSLGSDQMLANLPTDVDIVVYCWTGQHSSQVTAYLRTLGYRAFNLQFGANALYHSSLTANAWGPSQQNDYELEYGPLPSAEFLALAEAGAAYINDNTDSPGVISAQALHDNLDEYTVIDIRAADAYNAGHIEGAYNSSLATLLTDVGTTIPTDKPFVIACYSGQSAGFAKFALEMMGYEDVSTLGFGMSSWNSTLSTNTWNNPSNVGNYLTNSETTNNNGDLTWHDYPALTGDTSVAGRVAAVLAEGFKSKKYADIQDNLEEYFILNYHSLADYEGTGTNGVPGHIPGAYQFTPYESLGLGQMLANLPTDLPIVVYCWTGQNSAQVVAYLCMLGYDAYSLSYGANSLYYDSLTNNAVKWEASDQRNFDLFASSTLAVR